MSLPSVETRRPKFDRRKDKTQSQTRQRRRRAVQKSGFALSVFCDSSFFPPPCIGCHRPPGARPRDVLRATARRNPAQLLAYAVRMASAATSRTSRSTARPHVPVVAVARPLVLTWERRYPSPIRSAKEFASHTAQLIYSLNCPLIVRSASFHADSKWTR